MIPEYLDIPIFPLPNVTFFPQTYLPLHVFEPRYRAMTANCLKGDRMMGVALLKDGWQSDYFGRPPICKTFGVGKVIDHQRLSDGRYDIVLEGVYRVRLVQEFPSKPYRVGRVQVLQELPIDTRREQVSMLMKELRELTVELARLVPDSKDAISIAWAAHPHPLVAANQLAAALVIDAYDRQSILEQDDPIRRLKLLLVQLRTVVYQLSGGYVYKEEMVEEE
ncbi:LON peptidase substrate-binding domain-containing protein [bacterium]|nr:LON peptidase substrate-binding domain-containing protein [bacterium]